MSTSVKFQDSTDALLRLHELWPWACCKYRIIYIFLNSSHTYNNLFKSQFTILCFFFLMKLTCVHLTDYALSTYYCTILSLLALALYVSSAVQDERPARTSTSAEPLFPERCERENVLPSESSRVESITTYCVQYYYYNFHNYTTPQVDIHDSNMS